MRAIVQRVKRAKVNVNKEKISEIGKGLLIFIAVGTEDDERDLEYMCDKISGLRIFEDEDFKMNKSLSDLNLELLLVSQFTLYGDVRKGKRPSFIDSAKSEKGEEYYKRFIEMLKSKGIKVSCGIFGADMEVELVNDGPCTIQISSKKLY